MFTVVPDKAPGSVFSEANWDTHIKDNLNTGCITPIAQTILTSATAQIDFSGIAADWMHLLLVWHARSSAASPEVGMDMQFNGLTTSIYDTQTFLGSAASESASESLAANNIAVGSIPASTASASRFGPGYVILPHYANSVHHKTALSFTGWIYGVGTGDAQVGMRYGHFRNVDPITQVTLFPSVGSFAIDTCATLYGMGGKA